MQKASENTRALSLNLHEKVDRCSSLAAAALATARPASHVTGLTFFIKFLFALHVMLTCTYC